LPKIIKFDENDKATHEWLDSLKKGTRHTYKSFWHNFLGFIGMTGDQILADRKHDGEHKWEKKVLQFKKWLITEKGYAEYTATTGANCVRGFFSFHYTKLEYRRVESKILGEQKRKTEDYRFSIQDFKKISEVADLEEKYVVLAGKSFGMRAGDFLRLTRGDLNPYLDREAPISIGEYATEKERVKAYPFIDVDALPIIKLMIEKMDREGRTDPSERVLTYKHTVQLSRVLRRVTERAGLKTGSKVVRFHCLRKFLIDHISSYMSESKWKQIVGKTITEGAYVSPDTLRKDYKRAMEETCFSNKPEGDIEAIAKKQVLLQLAKNMGITETQIKKMFARTRSSLAGQIESLEKMIEEKRRREAKGENEDCPDGVHCGEEFKQITENELLEHLKQGWRIAHELNNGEVIVKR